MQKKSRLEKLKEIFEVLDLDHGYGPDDEIIDESKINIYIQNFLNKFNQYPDIISELSVINESYGKSILEALNDV